ncbi:phosphopantetheine-binding protein [Streptomyces massasporeus]|uniref:phosphopantetheine-binding protein n=1 Tax=Streptomyces massasporeus TaxID=67324 RepID=UPI0036F7DD66
MSEMPSPYEELVLEQFRTFTGNGNLSATDDFFGGGGDSFVAVHTVSAVASIAGVELSPSSIFAHRTARAFAAHVSTVTERDNDREEG